MKQRVEGFFQSFDMFSASASLRAKGSSTITRTSAGVISFVLFCYFAYIFIVGIYRIFTFQSIISSQTFQKIPLTSIYAENFMFGIGNLRIEPALFITEFEIKTMIVSNKQGIIQNITMTPCEPQQWKKLGEDYQEQFRLHYLDRFVCPTYPQKLKLINSSLIQDAVYFQVLIQPRMPSSASYRSLLKKMAQYESNKFNVFYLDQAVIPNEQQGVEFFVNINNFAFVSSFKKHQTLIRLSNYKISTDYSIIPIYTDQEDIVGYNIADAVLTDSDSNLEAENCKIKFELTNDLYIYHRKVGKIDEMFSYAGGLFALVIWCLAFFVSPFNKYRYELMVAESTFNFDKDGHKVREKEFNFFKYMKYSLYLWTRDYLCFKPNWQDCKTIQETIKEANDQMDVTRLFRKLQFLQMALIHNMNESQNLLIALTQPRSLAEVKEQRLILEYYFFIIKGEPAATVEDAIDGNAMRFKNLMQTQSKYDELGIQEDRSSNREAMLQPHEEIKQKLMEYLNLSDFQKVCEAISNYPKALEQAKAITLSPELNLVQEHLTQYFLKLKPLMKIKIMKKFPLKIVHRLCLKSQQMRNRKEQEVPIITQQQIQP